MSRGNTIGEFDAQAFNKMKEEMQISFDEKMKLMTQTYQSACNDLQDQYRQNQDKLDVMQYNAMVEHNQRLDEQNEAFSKAEKESKDANAERQKIQLETKKLMNMKKGQQEIAATTPAVITNGNNEHHISPRYAVQQRVNVRQSAPSYANSKKKAADFYFQKNKPQESTTPKAAVTKRKSDFMTRDISPQQTKKKSLERQSTYTKKEENGFSYDRPTQSATNRQIATAQTTSTGGAPTFSPAAKVSPQRNAVNGRRSRPDPAAWKNGASTSSKKAEAPSAPHRAYVPPALAPKMQNDDLYHHNPSALQQPASPVFKPSVPSQPDLPQKLIDEFKSEPQNYPGLIPALHDGESFGNCVEQWRKLGVLYAEDIMRNAPNQCPVDYHLRVSENDTQSAFGQVDKNGRMQGIGRECHNFIYEGQFKDNVYHGWGRYISSQGVYWGLFNMGLRHGQGKWVGAGGDTREGNWVNGQMK